MFSRIRSPQGSSSDMRRRSIVSVSIPAKRSAISSTYFLIIIRYSRESTALIVTLMVIPRSGISRFKENLITSSTRRLYVRIVSSASSFPLGSIRFQQVRSDSLRTSKSLGSELSSGRKAIALTPDSEAYASIRPKGRPPLVRLTSSNIQRF